MFDYMFGSYIVNFHILFILLRILSVLSHRFVWKSSETQDSIYGHVESCIGHSNVNRLDKNRFVLSRRFVILAFRCSYRHAILIELERRLFIGGPNRLGIKVSLCAERNESKKTVPTKQWCLRCWVFRHCIYYVRND